MQMDRQMWSTAAHLSGSGGQAWADSRVHPCRSDHFWIWAVGCYLFCLFRDRSRPPPHSTPKHAPTSSQLVKNLPAMQETPVQFLGQEDPLEKGQATHSSILGLLLWLSW